MTTTASTGVFPGLGATLYAWITQTLLTRNICGSAQFHQGAWGSMTAMQLQLHGQMLFRGAAQLSEALVTHVPSALLPSALLPSNPHSKCLRHGLLSLVLSGGSGAGLQCGLPTTSVASRMEPATTFGGKCGFVASPQTLTGNKSSIPTVRLKSLNPVIKKQHKMRFFQTLNNAKFIWDSRSKPKGLLLGHINIRSIVTKAEQMEHLLIDSNIDILGILESWLTHSSPTAAINIPGYNTFRRDRGIGQGDYWFM